MTGRLVILGLLGVFTLQTEYIHAIALPLEKTADPKIDKTLLSESSVALTRMKRGQKFGEVPDYTVVHNPPTKPICLKCQNKVKPSLQTVPDYTVLHNPTTKPICLNCQNKVKPSIQHVPDYTVLHIVPTKPICLNCQNKVKPSLQHVPDYTVLHKPPTKPICLNCKYEVIPPPQHDVPGYPVQNVHPTSHHEVTPSPRYGPGNRWLYQTSVRPICLNCKYEPAPHGRAVVEGPKLYKVQPLNHPSLVY